MIGLLSAIGRAIVVTAAVLTVIGFSIGGYLTARTQEAVLYGGSFAISGGGRICAEVPDLVIPEAVWRRAWILHVTAWGNGEQAVLDYLARYVFRVALANARIVRLVDLETKPPGAETLCTKTIRNRIN